MQDVNCISSQCILKQMLPDDFNTHIHFLSSTAWLLKIALFTLKCFIQVDI